MLMMLYAFLSQAVLEANLPPLPYLYEVDLLNMCTCANMLPLSYYRLVSHACINMKQVRLHGKKNIWFKIQYSSTHSHDANINGVYIIVHDMMLIARNSKTCFY